MGWLIGGGRDRERLYAHGICESYETPIKGDVATKKAVKSKPCSAPAGVIEMEMPSTLNPKKLIIVTRNV